MYICIQGSSSQSGQITLSRCEWAIALSRNSLMQMSKANLAIALTQQQGTVNMCIQRAPLHSSDSITLLKGKNINRSHKHTTRTTQHTARQEQHHSNNNTRHDKNNTTNDHTMNYPPALNNDRRWRGDGAYHLTLSLYKILFYFKALLCESISLSLPTTTCKAYPIAIPLHDHCAIYAPPPTPPPFMPHTKQYQ